MISDVIAYSGGMATRPLPYAPRAAATTIGEQLSAWRRLLGLPAKVVAERAGISTSTLSKLENGDPGVALGTFLNVCRALGMMDQVVTATDPYETPLGRARADQSLPKRIRS